jgi:hypothetical protein
MTTINPAGNGLKGTTGTGTFVGANTPTLITPVLGAATATSINFGGSTLSNYLVDQTWTPVLTFATAGNLSVSYAVQVGNYSRIGNMVFANIYLQCTPTFTTASGAMEITGLPLTSNSTSNNNSVGVCYTSGITYGTGLTSAALVLGSNSSTLVTATSGSAEGQGQLTTASFTTGDAFLLVGSIAYPI